MHGYVTIARPHDRGRIAIIRAQYREDFELFQDKARYEGLIREVNNDLCGARRSRKDPAHTFVADRPLFRMAGNLEIPGPKVVGIGLNPYLSSSRPLPACWREHYRQERDRFSRPATVCHRWFLAVIRGLGLPDVPDDPPSEKDAWQAWLARHFLVADILPYRSRAYRVGSLNPVRVGYFREQFAVLEKLLHGQDLRLVIFNGKIFEELFFSPREDLRLGPPFTLESSAIIKRVKKTHRSLVAGTVPVAGRAVPALIATHFLSRAGAGYQGLKEKAEELCRNWRSLRYLPIARSAVFQGSPRSDRKGHRRSGGEVEIVGVGICPIDHFIVLAKGESLENARKRIGEAVERKRFDEPLLTEDDLRGQGVRYQKYKVQGGGNVPNVLDGLGRLGRPGMMVGLCGGADSEGTYLADSLHPLVDTSRMRAVHNARSRHHLILLSQGNRDRAPEKMPLPEDEREVPSLYRSGETCEELLGNLPPARVLHVNRANGRIISLAEGFRESGAKVSFAPHSCPWRACGEGGQGCSFCTLLARTDLLVLSAESVTPNFCQHLGVEPGHDVEDRLSQVLLRLLERSGTLELAVITRGGGGLLATRRGDPVVSLPAFPVETLEDPTGAGDAFVAALLHRLVEAGWPAVGDRYYEALKWASAGAALNCREIGGRNLPPAKTIDEYLSRFEG